jgi:hypothetical protein
MDGRREARLGHLHDRRSRLGRAAERLAGTLGGAPQRRQRPPVPHAERRRPAARAGLPRNQARMPAQDRLPRLQPGRPAGCPLGRRRHPDTRGRPYLDQRHLAWIAIGGTWPGPARHFQAPGATRRCGEDATGLRRSPLGCPHRPAPGDARQRAPGSAHPGAPWPSNSTRPLGNRRSCSITKAVTIRLPVRTLHGCPSAWPPSSFERSGSARRIDALGLSRTI